MNNIYNKKNRQKLVFKSLDFLFYYYYYYYYLIFGFYFCLICMDGLLILISYVIGLHGIRA